MSHTAAHFYKIREFARRFRHVWRGAVGILQKAPASGRVAHIDPNVRPALQRRLKFLE